MLSKCISLNAVAKVMLFSDSTNFFVVFFQKKFVFPRNTCLVHTIPIVVVSKFAQYIQFAIAMEERQRRVIDAVEHIRLHGRIVDHVFEDDVLHHFQFVVETPKPHVVATQTTAPT